MRSALTGKSPGISPLPENAPDPDSVLTSVHGQAEGARRAGLLNLPGSLAQRGRTPSPPVLRGEGPEAGTRSPLQWSRGQATALAGRGEFSRMVPPNTLENCLPSQPDVPHNDRRLTRVFRFWHKGAGYWRWSRARSLATPTRLGPIRVDGSWTGGRNRKKCPAA